METEKACVRDLGTKCDLAIVMWLGVCFIDMTFVLTYDSNPS
jgi:hypothetical protein